MVTGNYYIWTSYSYSNSILEGYQMKKIYALIALTATAVFSGLAMSKFLNWAGQQEIFDFDLTEDIDHEELCKNFDFNYHYITHCKCHQEYCTCFYKKTQA